MTLCGAYARAGRETVVATVLDLLGAETTMTVHNHHNYLWEETHNGESLFVVRKGATPCWPGQVSFIGGSMADISVIIRGMESDDTRASFYSTVHGAGRVMSRTAAAGKMNYKTKTRSGGAISQEMMENAINRYGVTVRGGGPDESPFVYRPLDSVLAAHADTFTILHTLRPVVVVMAGANEVDPYKD
jgi:tRNA-splicing ligase RtcB